MINVNIKYIVATLLVASIMLVLTPALVEAKTFNGHSYSFTYPNGCKPDKDQNKYSDSIQLECKEDMLIQLNAGGLTGHDLANSAESEIADDMLNAFSDGWEDVSEVERGNITIGNTSAPYVIATYTQTYLGLFGLPNGNTEDFVVMLVGIKTNDGYVLAQYKNNAGDFDKGKSIAEKIFTSVKPKAISTNGNGNTGQSDYERCQSEAQDQYENLRDQCGDET